jgi:phage tail sheath protein FI
MPVTPTYPGVYIEEVPSGVRTVTGVATSITAFIGRALRGPADQAVTINSYGEFERLFGGLAVDCPMSYAVRDFYLNGGTQAIIVRLYQKDAGAGAKPASAKLSADTLKLVAASPGAWANTLRARVDYNTRPPIGTETATTLFNLTVRDTASGQTEQFRNVAVDPAHPRRVDNVLQNNSSLVLVDGALPAARPAASNDPPAGGDRGADNPPPTNGKVDAGAQASNGGLLADTNFTGGTKEADKQGLYALKQADLFNLLCIPPYLDPQATGAATDVSSGVISSAAAFCQQRRAFLLIDPPSAWTSPAKALAGIGADIGDATSYAAVFFPRLSQPDPLRDNQFGSFVPCGAVAGVMARTDANRGVWKAPAGLDATLVGVPDLDLHLDDAENGELNPKGINCLRILPAAGRVVWGSRTRRGDDMLADDWKYIPVRRLALYLEESLYRGTQWVVFEPNDEPLWAQIRTSVGAFLHDLFRRGAFQGSSPKEAYFVKCDKDTTTQSDINLGIVNIVVGFAPLKPAEFVILQIQQLAGQVAT